jgi:hypothetical protein
MTTNQTPSSRWRSPSGIFMLVAGAVGVYYLLTEHLTHVTQAIPYLILLACPLMHLFGHHHGGGGHHHPRPEQEGQDAAKRE